MLLDLHFVYMNKNFTCFFILKFSTLNPIKVSSSVSAIKNIFEVDEFLKIQYSGSVPKPLS